MALKAFNTLLQYDAGAGFLTVAEIMSIGYGFTNGVLDVTNMESDQCRKEKITGILDEGEISLEVNYVPSDATHQQVLTDRGVSRSWRITLPDFGATSVDVSSIDTGTDIITAVASHGLTEAHPVKLSTTGTLPTSTPQVVSGNLYYAEVVDADELVLHTTSADAVAATNDIDFSTSGSGTHTILKPSVVTFTGFVSAFSPTAAVDAALTGTVTITVSGSSTYPS